jgi:precorrin-6B methylase 2
MTYPTLLAASMALVATACARQDDRQEAAGNAVAQPAKRTPDVVFVPTPEPVVERMLAMAEVGPKDIVYDLGCGDGRIPIAAVRDFNAARAVCVDIDPQRVREARANVEEAGLEDRIEVIEGDLFEQDLTEATVVTLYLLESLNLKLRPKLHAELRPGARVVSQSFAMGDWKPDEQTRIEGKPVYLWIMPGQRRAEADPRH